MLVAWGVGFCLVLFGSLKLFRILRVDSRIEVHGMDAVKHGEPAYPAESWVRERQLEENSRNQINTSIVYLKKRKEEQQYWDHQVHRLVHLLSAATVDKSSSTHKISADSMTSVDLSSTDDFRVTGLPPQMNFAHLVLTDHFQKCVLTLDSRRTGWNYIATK